MAKNAVVFRHMNGDDAGLFSELFAEDEIDFRYVDWHRGEEPGDISGHDLLLVLGGAQQVWEEAEHPWLQLEKQVIRKWVVEYARPYIGICLGHQLLADALGGTVAMSDLPEVGIHPLSLTESGTHAFVSRLKNRSSVMQWHLAEVTRAPEMATVLASSPSTDIQVMAVGDHALGVQFHFEWTSRSIRGWADIDGWVPAFERHLGRGAHQSFVDQAEARMPDFHKLTRTMYDGFKAASGLRC